MPFFDPIRIGASGAAADFTIDRSLRFNSGDSPELTRTPSGAGNRTTWTLSFWAKISDDDLGSHGFLFSTGGDANNKVQINLESDNRITFEAKSGGSTQAYIRPSNNLRDVSAWYHFLIHVNTTHATTDNRLIIYINGEDTRSNLSQNTYPSQNTEFEWNKAQEHNIGKRTYSSNFFNGYLAEINFIDGSALFADSFTETNSITGQLIPKRYTGSYGTNGFHLNFSDNSGTTATTLGKDSSGNGNNFTPNNFSVSAGAGNDSLEDTPTNNFSTLSPLLTDTRSDSSFSQGNLTATTGSGASTIGSTFAQTTGKWYAEFVCTAKSSTNMMIGVNSVEGFDGERQGNESQNGGVGYGYINNGNNALPDGSNNSYGATWAINDVMSIALDLDNNTVNFYKNNAAQGTISIADGYNYVMTFGHGQGGVTATFDANFGQRAFSYTPPTGFKALNSANLPDPTILLPDKHFDTLLYTGSGSSSLNNITGLEFQPDWVWGNARNDTIGNILFDAVRGDDKQLSTDITAAEVTRGSAAYRFLSNGFAVSNVGNLNNSSVNYVAWCWFAGGSTVTNTSGTISSQVRANTTAGFSIVSYSGNGSSGATVGHGLGVVPDQIIIRRREGDNWMYYSHSLNNGSSPQNFYLELNEAGGQINDSRMMNNTAPTSTVFSLRADNSTNGGSSTYIAYCFSEVIGYSKFGRYTGNGNSNGTFVMTGFRPAFVIIKCRSASEHWRIFDYKRSPINQVNRHLFVSNENVESTETGLDFLANGFKFRDGDTHQNGNGEEYIYLAFAESPFKYSRAR